MSPESWSPAHTLDEAGDIRLSMREFTHTDLDDIISLHKAPRIRDLLIDDAPLDDIRLVQRFIERLRDYYLTHPGLGIWAAHRWAPTLSAEDAADPDVQATFNEAALRALCAPSPQFVGWFSLMRNTDLPDELEIGGRLLPQAWGSGLVLDGGERLLDQAFDRLGHSHVWGICHPDHRSVHHVLLTLGAVHDGLRPCDGVDSRWFRIDADTWRQVRHLPRKVRQRQALRHMP